MTSTLALTALDEAFLDLARRTVMSVQFEVRVQGRLDADRLREAMHRSIVLHPLARARLADASVVARRRHWEVSDESAHLPLEVTDDPPEDVRARLQSQLPELSRSPGFLAALVHDDRGDLLMLNLHHAVFDGLSAVRFVTSVARFYSGTADTPGGPADIAAARDLRKIAGARSLADVIPRASKIAGSALQRRVPLLRIAPDGAAGPPSPLYAFATARLRADEVARALERKPTGATVNDLLLAAHALTIRRWNADHGIPARGRLSIMMPVNLRPAEWSTEVLSNYASYLAVMVPADASDDLADATRKVAAITAPLKRDGVAGWMVDVLGRRNDVVPVAIRRHFFSLLPLVEGRFVESTVLSNLGRTALPAFGDAGNVDEVWFSPPCIGGEVMPLAVGAAGVGGELHIVVRTLTSEIGPDGARRYAEALRETLG